MNKYYILLIIELLCLQYCLAEGKDKPQTKLINPDVLMQNKAALKNGDPVLIQALSELKEKAEKSINNGPYSVVYKKKTPPSGDKHDYMSVGPYWWPDPTKPNGLPYIRKDGQINPERYDIQDAEFFKKLCDDVTTLALYSYFTDDNRYGKKAANLLHTWFVDSKTRMNPHLNFGQAIPGHTEGRGIGLIDTRESAQLVDGIQLLKATGCISESNYASIREWYKEFLVWMLASPIGLDEADEHNNHGTYYDVQSVSIALFTGQNNLAEEILENQTKNRIKSQLKEDGSQPHELARTLSWNYSLMNLEGFFELALLANNTDIDLWNYETPDGKSIKKAFLWLFFFTGDKPWTHQQIKPLKKTDLSKTAAIASQQYKDIEQGDYLEKNKKLLDCIFILTNEI